MLIRKLTKSLVKLEAVILLNIRVHAFRTEGCLG